MKYSQTAKAFLKKNNKAELLRLQRAGKLEEFLKDAEDLFGDQEQTHTIGQIQDI